MASEAVQPAAAPAPAPPKPKPATYGPAPAPALPVIPPFQESSLAADYEPVSDAELLLLSKKEVSEWSEELHVARSFAMIDAHNDEFHEWFLGKVRACACVP